MRAALERLIWVPPGLSKKMASRERAGNWLRTASIWRDMRMILLWEK
jgi:hypothetical protein